MRFVQISRLAFLLAGVSVMAGCDTIATRTLRIHQDQSVMDKQPDFIVDTSQLPLGVITRSEEKEGKTGPVTDIYLDLRWVKIVIVPIAAGPEELGVFGGLRRGMTMAEVEAAVAKVTRSTPLHYEDGASKMVEYRLSDWSVMRLGFGEKDGLIYVRHGKDELLKEEGR